MKRVTYEYGCIVEQENECLRNEIGLMGAKVVLVNLDDNCQMEQITVEGLFIQTGDYIIMTGREIPTQDLRWTDVCDCSCCDPLDKNVLQLTDIFDSPTEALPCYN